MNDHHLNAARHLWDEAATAFDQEADHGLRDPAVRAAWHTLLETWLPPTPARILDIGCGTGSLSLLMAELGHTVTGIDFSPAMLAHAEAKAAQANLSANLSIQFHLMDASDPQLAPQQVEVILCRHLLWTLPQPDQVLTRWDKLLTPGGRLILIEGFWHTGAGLRAQTARAALPVSFINVIYQNLSEQTELWGGPINDERYAIIADKPITPEAW